MNALNPTTASTNFYNQQVNIQDDSLISAPQDSLDFSMNARTLQQPFSSPGDLGGNNGGERGRDETYDRSSSSFPNHHQISLFNDQVDNSQDAINATTTSLVDVTDRENNSNINSSYVSIKPVDQKQQEERGQKQQRLAQQLAPMSAAAQYNLAVKKSQSQKSVGGVTSTSSPSSSSSSSALSSLNSNSLMGPQRPTSSKKLPQKKGIVASSDRGEMGGGGGRTAPPVLGIGYQSQNKSIVPDAGPITTTTRRIR
jgi:hypothetical protein